MKWPGHRSTHLGSSSANVERVAGPDKPREFLIHVLRAAHLEALRPLRHTHLRLRHLLRKMSPACTKMWKALLPSSRNAYTAVGVTNISYSTLLLSDDVGTVLLLVGGTATRDVSAAWETYESLPVPGASSPGKGACECLPTLRLRGVTVRRFPLGAGCRCAPLPLLMFGRACILMSMALVCSCQQVYRPVPVSSASRTQSPSRQLLLGACHLYENCEICHLRLLQVCITEYII